MDFWITMAKGERQYLVMPTKVQFGTFFFFWVVDTCGDLTSYDVGTFTPFSSYFVLQIDYNDLYRNSDHVILTSLSYLELLADFLLNGRISCIRTNVSISKFVASTHLVKGKL